MSFQTPNKAYTHRRPGPLDIGNQWQAKTQHASHPSDPPTPQRFTFNSLIKILHQNKILIRIRQK